MKKDEYEVTFVKKRELLKLVKILSNSEPVIARDSNGLSGANICIFVLLWPAGPWREKKVALRMNEVIR